MPEGFEILAAFVAYGGVSNWLAGGQKQWRKRLGLPGRSIYYMGLLAIIVGWFTYGGVGALAGLTFLLWRLPGWYGALDAGVSPLAKPGEGKIFGIDVRPLRLRDFIVMSSRGLLAFPLFVFVAWRDQTAAPLFVLVVASLAIGGAYDLACRYFKNNTGLAEALTGCVWGIAFFMMLEG